MSFMINFINNKNAILVFQTAQLCLITFVVYAFSIEQELGLASFMALFCFFFPIHSVASIRFKSLIQQIWFLAVLFIFLSPANAIKVLLVSGILLSILFSRISSSVKLLLLSTAAIYLFLCRFGILYSLIPPHALTVIAGIFMFRSIIYLYDDHHGAQPKNLLDKTSYFFLAPNIIFPLFPIIDLQTFQRTKYNTEPSDIYQRGINLIVWALLCLLFYRLVYYFGLPDVFKLKGLFDVLQYLGSSYLTVIRLVGILSLSVGILRMVGYNLPEIFNFMFLARSFSDLFRRINMYWKDFMMKLVYYPVYFKLRKAKSAHLITYALIITFILTWFFHIYQWSWILGSNPIRGTGLIYWGVFGVLAILGTFKERKIKAIPKPTFANAFRTMFNISLVFIGMCLLYTIWINASLTVWWNMVRIAALDGPVVWLKAIGLWLLIVLTGGALGFVWDQIHTRVSAVLQKSRFTLAPVALICLCFLWALIRSNQKPAIKQYLDNVALNSNDIRQQNEGYYESILKADISSKLWDDGIDLELIKQKKWLTNIWLNSKDKRLSPLEEATGVAQQERDDQSKFYQKDKFLNFRFKPNLKTIYKGKPLHTNSEGFRDKEYTKQRAPNTTRIVLIGGSPDVGYGVDNDELYEAIIENKLNVELAQDSVEIINLSLVDLGLLSKVYVLEEIALKYKPDIVLLIEHFDDADRENDRLDRILRKDIVIYPALKKEFQRINITEEDIRMRQIEEAKIQFLISWAYHYFASTCKNNNIKPYLVYVPVHGNSSKYNESVKMFKGAEFEFIDLKNLYDVFPIDQIRLSVKDNHPNALGHRIIVHGLEPVFRNILNIK